MGKLAISWRQTVLSTKKLLPGYISQWLSSKQQPFCLRTSLGQERRCKARPSTLLHLYNLLRCSDAI